MYIRGVPVHVGERKGFIRLVRKALSQPAKIPLALRTELFTLRVLAAEGFPDYLLQFLGGIGDELLLTAVAREIKKREPGAKIWQVSHSPGVLENNPDYSRVFSWDYLPLRFSNLLNRSRVRLRYTEFSVPGEVEIPPKRHIIAELCARAGVRGEIAVRPYLHLTPEEERRGRLAPRQIVIHCVGERAHETYMANKVWPKPYYDELIMLLSNRRVGREYRIIQVGTERDPGLPGVLDLRGRTTLRETAAILRNADAFVGGSGLLSHMARAVDCRAVVIYGGREHSYQSGYVCNENLDTFVDCAPCWRWNTCDFNRKCLHTITPQMVDEALDRVLARKNEPLGVELVTV